MYDSIAKYMISIQYTWFPSGIFTENCSSLPNHRAPTNKSQPGRDLFCLRSTIVIRTSARSFGGGLIGYQRQNSILVGSQNLVFLRSSRRVSSVTEMSHIIVRNGKKLPVQLIFGSKVVPSLGLSVSPVKFVKSNPWTGLRTVHN